jgi:hypothetical protein
MNLLQLLGNPEGLQTAYRLFGRGQMKNALVGVLGSRNKLASIAAKNRDEVQEAVDKRDAAVEAILDYAEELANLDQD